MKLALVHDYLAQDGGAEQVLEALMGIYPDAPTYTLFFDVRRLPRFNGRDIRSSYLEKLPLARSHYQWYLPLMPSAAESLDVSDFDVVLSNASAFAKGVITKPGAIHICYCHTPTRYLWSDTHSYVQELSVPRFVKAFLPPLLSHLRLWDRHAADRVDHFIANSETVKQRIKKYYDRDATVIHPPVNISQFHLSTAPKKYFLTGGRLVSYKRFDLVIEACNKTGLPLVIFGSGPVEAALRKQAGSTVTFVGRVDNKELAKLYANAKAFIHPQEEDLGLTPIESMASGRPVIAYRRGGATETVVENVTGQFFDDQSWEELADMLIRFDETKFDPAAIRKHAEGFGPEVFAEKIKAFVEKVQI